MGVILPDILSGGQIIQNLMGPNMVIDPFPPVKANVELIKLGAKGLEPLAFSV